MCDYLDNTSRYWYSVQYVVCNFLHIVEISAPQQDTSSVVVSALGGGACCWWGSCIITRTCKINDAYLRVPAGTGTILRCLSTTCTSMQVLQCVLCMYYYLADKKHDVLACVTIITMDSTGTMSNCERQHVCISAVQKSHSNGEFEMYIKGRRTRKRHAKMSMIGGKDAPP